MYTHTHKNLLQVDSEVSKASTQISIIFLYNSNVQLKNNLNTIYKTLQKWNT